jgi:hypothetical protein
MNLAMLLILQDAQTLEAVKAGRAPALDGDGSDACWAQAKPLTLTLKKALEPDPRGHRLELRAVVVEDTLFLLAQWDDETADERHKPWVWNREKNKYEAGPQIEDAFSIGFPLEGEFNPNMLAALKAKWDVWHWKAARTNPKGWAMDRTHAYSTEEFKGAIPFPTSSGNVYIARPEDEGRSVCVKAKAPAEFKGEAVPSFDIQEPDGSAADVRAKGAWKDKRWTLELSRKLKTGHADDRPFEPGEKIPFAVACFDKSEHEEHTASDTLVLALPK